MKNNLGELIISILLVGLLLLFLNPLTVMMPSSMHEVMIPLLVVLCIILVGVLWREKASDERESLHRYIGARFAYFAAITTLVSAIIIEHFQGTIDPWLVITVCVILLAKIVGNIYGRFTH